MRKDLASRKMVFKGYDIRGTYPDQINEELVEEVSRALIKKVFGKGKVVVGHDVRKSSPQLYKAVLGALKALEGVEVLEVGLMTTPMLAFLIKDTNAVGGICITASHNPKEYNGLKMIKGGEDLKVVGGKEIYELMR